MIYTMPEGAFIMRGSSWCCFDVGDVHPRRMEPSEPIRLADGAHTRTMLAGDVEHRANTAGLPFSTWIRDVVLPLCQRDPEPMGDA